MKGILSAILLSLTLSGSRAMAVEEPAYKTILQDGAFEVRDYPALVVAEVTVTGGQKEAGSNGFRILAAYIFGANKSRHGIAMTAPVAQQRASEKIAMTAPVTQTHRADAWVVRFNMPSAYSLLTLPQPNDPRVHLSVLPPTRMAVLRFSGLAQADDAEAKTAELIVQAKSHRLTVNGDASLAQYNPPWTLWFMRRNEVMVPVER